MAERLHTPPEDHGPRNRLPTLMEVLNRQTLAPVDLFSFYIFMRDQQRSVDYLDFWLDVSQHLSLCRHYVRGLRRSVLVDTPDAEKALASRHSSQLLDSFDLIDNAPQHTSASAREEKNIHHDRERDHRLSSFLRSTDSSSSSGGSAGSRHSHRHNRSDGTRRSLPRSTRSRSSTPGQSSSNASTSSHHPGVNPAVAREDIRASAEKILYTFLLAGSEREIVLPEGILASITIAIEEAGRDDPEVFDAAKDYVFAAMERDAFTEFLRRKALGNLVPLHMTLRVILGCVSLFLGFWAAFALVFLDRGRRERCWLILPFAVAVYLIASHQYTLDPVLALAGYSEYTFLTFAKVREPFIRRLLAKRGLVVTWVIIGVAAALSCLFIFVPGKRL